MSAALQPAHQPTSMPTLNPADLAPASPPNRPYPSNHSLPSREGYHANQQNTDTSPSSRRPSRRRSGNGASPGGQSVPNSPVTTRATSSSVVPVTTASSDYPTSTFDRRRNMPPIAPPRTSSTQHGQGGSAGGPTSRRAGYANERGTNSPRRPATSDNNRYDVNGNADTDDAAGQNSRARRTQHASPQDPTMRTSSRDGRSAAPSTTLPVRSNQTSTATSSRGPSREASEVLNRVLVSQPEVDIEREKERMALSHPHRSEADEAAPPPVIGTGDHAEDGRRGQRSRHDHSKREKHTKFEDYILGNTIGEGEFGKVKLGWKQDGGVQVAIKLIKKDSLGNNPSRMQKILREVAILKQLSHPNIVRLHEMAETERHYGIVLEYASGGELFDYILNHRYLKDNAARRLFAQLVSGVGYLHKKGIVHRDLKLENLLLDRNRNIIITDFGFANTFDPHEELTEDEETNLSNREFVKQAGLDYVKPNGMRKGDLMQTSCGSPCYAAPELVVSDSLYTGRKVDVWSCGVILYAMLAGYLPFDDDPANPEGDNINLLYKYIVNTPLTFPEYVTPHARDLLKRILVPNPRRRADLFEVARHSWLSEYAHVVEFITSSTTTSHEIQNTTVPAEDESPPMARSASVREQSKSKSTAPPSVGGLASKQGTVDPDVEAAQGRQQKDNKRRTVQVEYVAPTTQTQRGEGTAGMPGKTRARSSSQGPVEVAESSGATPKDKPLPRDPPVSREAYGKTSAQSRRPQSSQRQQNPPPARPARDTARTASDYTYMTTAAGASGARPATGGSMRSAGSMGLAAGTRASYGKPLPPAVAGTNVHGRIQQPTSSGQGGAYQEGQNLEYGRPSISVPAKFARVSGFHGEGGGGGGGEAKGHRRSNTIGDLGGKLFGRSGSIFGGKNRKRTDQSQQQQAPQQQADKSRKYPPVSMSNMPGEGEPRQSMDSKRSRRSFSLGLGKKRSGSMTGSQTSQERHTRRFSLIPQSFSLSKAIGIGKDYGTPPPGSQQDLPIQEPPQVDQLAFERDPSSGDSNLHGQPPYSSHQPPAANSGPIQHQRYPSQQYGRPSAIPQYMQQDMHQDMSQGMHQGTHLNTGSDSSVDNMQRKPGSAPHQAGYSDHESNETGRGSSRGNRGVLQKNKRFVDAYGQDEYGRQHDHGGSSGAAKRVMDFFRRRGKARGGEDH